MPSELDVGQYIEKGWISDGQEIVHEAGGRELEYDSIIGLNLIDRAEHDLLSRHQKDLMAETYADFDREYGDLFFRANRISGRLDVRLLIPVRGAVREKVLFEGMAARIRDTTCPACGDNKLRFIFDCSKSKKHAGRWYVVRRYQVKCAACEHIGDAILFHSQKFFMQLLEVGEALVKSINKLKMKATPKGLVEISADFCEAD